MGLQEPGVVRPPIEDVGRGQAITFGLPAENRVPAKAHWQAPSRFAWQVYSQILVKKSVLTPSCPPFTGIVSRLAPPLQA
jgi:hypothetical protein